MPFLIVSFYVIHLGYYGGKRGVFPESKAAIVNENQVKFSDVNLSSDEEPEL